MENRSNVTPISSDRRTYCEQEVMLKEGDNLVIMVCGKEQVHIEVDIITFPPETGGTKVFCPVPSVPHTRKVLTKSRISLIKRNGCFILHYRHQRRIFYSLTDNK